PARRFGAKAVEPHELTWFNTQKKPTKRFNSLLETPAVDPSKCLILVEKLPYRDVSHTWFGEHSSAR
ncbi:hypothetical protein HAX54_043905, partial [Datura stramonium]|nr:hypothetical protein [Datura stramonium]